MHLENKSCKQFSLGKLDLLFYSMHLYEMYLNSTIESKVAINVDKMKSQNLLS